jgi:hypothetical protein
VNLHDIESSKDLAGEAGESDGVQTVGTYPVEIGCGCGNCTAQGAVVAATRGEDLDVVVGVGDGMAEPDRGLAAFDGVDGERRKFVHSGHQADVVGTAFEQDLGNGTSLAQREQMSGGAASLCGAGKSDVFAARLAHGEDGTVEAEGSTWKTDGRSKLHHGLVVVSGGVGVFLDAAARDEIGSLLLQEGSACGGAVFGLSEETEEHAFDVAVDYGNAFAKGDAGDCGAGVLADAGQGAELDGCIREDASAFFGDKLRGLMEHACAAIVPEAGPGGEDLLFVGKGEGEDGGEAAKEGMVVVDDRGDAGLLQHDFGDPGTVRVGDAAPGKLACMGAIPAHEASPKGGWIKLAEWSITG